MGDVVNLYNDKPMILTHSEMASWLSCQRGWYLSYFRRLRRIREYASLPSIGNLFHEGLEKYYRGALSDPAMFVATKAGVLVEKYPDREADIVKGVEWATIMLEGYMEWVETEGADVGLEVIGVEQAVDQPVGEFILRGKIDARLRREWDGALLQLEHKTVGSLSDIPKYAQSAPQFLTYDLLAFLQAQNSGEDVRTDGVLINMARRVKRTPSAKPPFYGRFEVRHNIEELRAHYRHIIAVGNQIKTATMRLMQGASHHDVLVPNVNRGHAWACRCQPMTAMFDDGSDVEEYLAEFYEEYDPWERYSQEEDGE